MNKQDFKNKITRQRRVLQEIFNWYRKEIDKSAKIINRNITGDKGTVYVKEDRMCHQTGYHALESITGAYSNDFVVLVDWEYVCLMTGDTLQGIYDELPIKKIRGDKNLIPIHKLLENKDVLVKERWFPVYDG